MGSSKARESVHSVWKGQPEGAQKGREEWRMDLGGPVENTHGMEEEAGYLLDVMGHRVP